jgi:predicted transposase/invertase (TIGR01784 family)
MPIIFKDEVFEQAFEKAEISNLKQSELDKYESSLKVYRDLKGVIDTAFDEGKMEGKIEGKIEMAILMKSAGESMEKIKRYTGLSEDEINKL